jgi:uncharacterized protein Veg
MKLNYSNKIREKYNITSDGGRRFPGNQQGTILVIYPTIRRAFGED